MTPPRLQPGDWITQDYSITDCITVTEQTTVYRAKNANKSGQYAIKVLELDPRSPTLADRVATFEWVVAQLGRMDNEYVPMLHEHGQLDDHTVYMVFEYIEGTSLRDILNNGPLPPARVKIIIKQLLTALQEAHDLGLIHQNITPSSIILVNKDNAEHDIALLDLGVDLIQTPSPTQLIEHDARYLAPESLADAKLGPAYDLYALGLIAYEMLVGKHPLDGMSRQEMLKSLMYDDAHQLPDHVLAPALLQVITDRLLQKDLSLRYQSATQVLQDFRSKSSTRNTSFVNSDMIKKMLEEQTGEQNEEDAITDAREAYQSNDAAFFQTPSNPPPEPLEASPDETAAHAQDVTTRPDNLTKKPVEKPADHPTEKQVSADTLTPTPRPHAVSQIKREASPQKSTRGWVFILLGAIVILGLIIMGALKLV